VNSTATALCSLFECDLKNEIVSPITYMETLSVSFYFTLSVSVIISLPVSLSLATLLSQHSRAPFLTSFDFLLAAAFALFISYNTH